ncbi:hypothetical protein MF271_21965 (plasmid) [Deinococcus sp. KNUC1210]|nr:hypothetical protein [Deinococcus sp. KNUC1210]ULH18146.1 hypothetical protein MF271_21965 [Deinococcus sp. KNUC1210]
MTYDPGEKPMYISVQAGSADELTGYWTKLKDGASVIFDLAPAPWGAPMYGMLKDRFGVTWVMDVQTNW